MNLVTFILSSCQHIASLTWLLGVQLLQQSPMKGRVSLFTLSCHGSSLISNRSTSFDYNNNTIHVSTIIRISWNMASSQYCILLVDKLGM